MRLRHEFVDYVPKQLNDGVLYVSIRFGTAVHQCACGCGEEVVTPLGPAEWKLTYDGKTVSLAPSIGNWSFPCRSHYWIYEGSVRWSRDFSEAGVALLRKEAAMRRAGYYKTEGAQHKRRPARRDTRHGLLRSIWVMVRAVGRAWGRGRE